MVDIEAAIIAYLREFDYEAFADVPNPRPDYFITVERTGGGDLEKDIDLPTVAVQSWSPTRYEASLLSKDVDALLLDMPGEVEDVMNCERDTLYNFPDPDSKTARYQGVYNFVTN